MCLVIQHTASLYVACLQVVVCTENDVDEQNDPSLYSLVRVIYLIFESVLSTAL